MYIWTFKKNYSRSVKCDGKDHKATAIMASIQPVLEDLINDGIGKVKTSSLTLQHHSTETSICFDFSETSV